MLRAETEEEDRDVDVEEVRGGAGATADRFSDRSVSRAVDDDEEEDVGRSEGMLRDGFTGAVESVGAVELVMSLRPRLEEFLVNILVVLVVGV